MLFVTNIVECLQVAPLEYPFKLSLIVAKQRLLVLLESTLHLVIERSDVHAKLSRFTYFRDGRFARDKA